MSRRASLIISSCLVQTNLDRSCQDHPYFSIMWVAIILASSPISSAQYGGVSFYVLHRLTTPKRLLFVTNNSIIHDVVNLWTSNSLIYDPSYNITSGSFLCLFLCHFLPQVYDLARVGVPVVPWLWDLLGCFVPRCFFLLLILITILVLPISSSLWLLLFSAYFPLVDILLPVVSCKNFIGGFLSLILGHIGTRYPIFFYIGVLILDVETSFILYEARVYIFPVVRSGRILFSLPLPG